MIIKNANIKLLLFGILTEMLCDYECFYYHCKLTVNVCTNYFVTIIYVFSAGLSLLLIFMLMLINIYIDVNIFIILM